MIGKTVDRVPTRAAPHANERIRRQTEMNIAYFGLRPEEIDSRLAELDTEWDIERVLETVASCRSLAGLVLRGVNRKRKWLLLTTMVQGFFCSTPFRAGPRRSLYSGALVSAPKTKLRASATHSRHSGVILQTCPGTAIVGTAPRWARYSGLWDGRRSANRSRRVRSAAAR